MSRMSEYLSTVARGVAILQIYAIFPVSGKVSSKKALALVAPSKGGTRAQQVYVRKRRLFAYSESPMTLLAAADVCCDVRTS